MSSSHMTGSPWGSAGLQRAGASARPTECEGEERRDFRGVRGGAHVSSCTAGGDTTRCSHRSAPHRSRPRTRCASPRPVAASRSWVRVSRRWTWSYSPRRVTRALRLALPGCATTEGGPRAVFMILPGAMVDPRMCNEQVVCAQDPPRSPDVRRNAHHSRSRVAAA